MRYESFLKIFTLVWLFFSLEVSFASDTSVIELYSEENSKAIANQNNKNINSDTIFANKNISTQSLSRSQKVKAFLPSKGEVLGRVHRNLDSVNDSLISHTQERISNVTVITLDNNAGSLELAFSEVDDRIALIRAFDANSMNYYEAHLDVQGKGTFKKLNIHKIQCFNYKLEHSSSIKLNVFSDDAINSAPANLTDDYIKSLQSNPSAKKVIFINAFGGILTNTAWNANYNSGKPIEFEPYDSDQNIASFSESELKEIWVSWKTTSEDYAPFDVNVTTNFNVYESAEPINRVQIISTTNKTRDSFYPNASTTAGVAFLNVFDIPNDYYRTGWTFFTQNPSFTGNVHSHESGHQIGLLHDGIYQRAYYGGHNDWGPIMGSNIRRFVQWSKGEYTGATNTEDDLQIIAATLGVLTDAEGSSFEKAVLISDEVEGLQGTITPEGLFKDFDFFTFKSNQERFVDIEAFNDFIYEGEQFGSNLTLSLKIYDSQRKLIYQDSDQSNDTNYLYGVKAGVPLTKGLYYIEVTNKSLDPNFDSGFTEYANGGRYRLSIRDIDTENLMSFTSKVTLNGSAGTEYRTSHFIPEYIERFHIRTFAEDPYIEQNTDLYIAKNRKPDRSDSFSSLACKSTSPHASDWCTFTKGGEWFNTMLLGKTDYSEVNLLLTVEALPLGDYDDDGVPNIYEYRYYKTDLFRSDSDGDGISDSLEIESGSDPLNSIEDTDGDGFTNIEEYQSGSNPYNKDETPLNLPSDTLPWLKILYSREK